MAQVRLNGGTATLQFTTTIGWRYRLEYMTDLNDRDWNPVAGEVTGNGSIQNLSDRHPAVLSPGAGINKKTRE